MARAVALLIVLLFAVCAPADGPCLAWCKNYLNRNSIYYRTQDRPNYPAIAVIESPGGTHAIVVTRCENGQYVYRDNGFMTSEHCPEGRIDADKILYWIGRSP